MAMPQRIARQQIFFLSSTARFQSLQPTMQSQIKLKITMKFNLSAVNPILRNHFFQSDMFRLFPVSLQYI